MPTQTQILRSGATANVKKGILEIALLFFHLQMYFLNYSLLGVQKAFYFWSEILARKTGIVSDALRAYKGLSYELIHIVVNLTLYFVDPNTSAQVHNLRISNIFGLRLNTDSNRRIAYSKRLYNPILTIIRILIMNLEDICKR